MITRGGILGVRCREHLLISSSTLPGLGRVSAKNVNKLTDFNAAVSSLDDNLVPMVYQRMVLGNSCAYCSYKQVSHILCNRYKFTVDNGLGNTDPTRTRHLERHHHDQR